MPDLFNSTKDSFSLNYKNMTFNFFIMIFFIKCPIHYFLYGKMFDEKKMGIIKLICEKKTR